MFRTLQLLVFIPETTVVPSKNADLLRIVPISTPRSFLDLKTDGTERRRFRRANNDLEEKYTDSVVRKDTH